MATKRLGIAVPASFISDTPHLREKTSKVGLVGRAAAIFTVDEIVVYRDQVDSGQDADLDTITSLLSYMETPQYLRKRLFKLEPQLQYAGILPPLRTPHHPLTKAAKDLKVGENREGFVLSKTREGALIDIGFEEPALLSGRQFTVGKRLTVKVVRVTSPVEVAIASPKDVKEYWGYTVSSANSLRQVLEEGSWGLRVATSRKGAPFTRVAKELAEKLRKAKSILIVFGAPARGLIEIAQDERFNIDQAVDCIVNTIPGQGTETVRTEEAILASLAIMKTQLGF
jgi:predicted SPOUT superfamily RNA methylase MTH1